MEINSHKTDNTNLWKRIAQIAAAFGLLISILLIANFLQLNTYDPVKVEVIDALVERLNETPNDEALRKQIRELDLLARKAYFTNQWQIKTGGYLLLISIAVVVIAFQMIDLNKRKLVTPDNDSTLDIFGIKKKAQKGVLFVGTAILVLAGILVIVTNRQMENRFSQRLASAQPIADTTAAVPQKTKTTVLPEKVIEQPIQKDTIAEVDTTQKADEIAKKIEEKPQEKSLTDSTTNKITKEEPQKKEKPKKATIASFAQLRKNFPSFRGFGGLGKVYHKNIPKSWDGTSGKNILWKTKIPIHGYNSPIVWGNKIFLTGANNQKREVYCFDRQTGKILWQKAITGIEGSPAKAPKTTPDTGLAASTMATDGLYVYAIFGTGDLAAFTMDGEMVWGRNLGVPQNHYGHSSSLYTYKDKLIVQYDQKNKARIMALNSATGKTIWSKTRSVKVSWASPIIINQGSKPEIILAAEPTVASYNVFSGKENWKLECITGEVGPSAAYDNGIVFSINEYSILSAIQIGDEPKLLWENDEYLSDIPSPIAANGLLIVATSYGALACYDTKTGDKYWEQEFDNNIFASPMLVGSNVYVLDKKGTMHIIKLSKTYQKVASPKLGIDNTVCTPAFADGRIYIRAGDFLYAIGK